ncbi:hypothetical protein SAMN05444000_12262 [Shimia gijangensis]|uniref:Uncharacterized protein n=1 Tax=Shimia gijangensis TaxID=1470563 RepID=A0A1M6QPB1_9RHOB|nr:hypothetical protein [Shimia gijangensis]SHK22132.1 hypothetical protein SAMN05444000_12262 [Shimia gijangensis]
MQVSRKELLTIANNYNVNQFKNLKIRDQLPLVDAVSTNDDSSGYSPANAIFLVLGDLISDNTGMSRDEIKIALQDRIPEAICATKYQSEGLFQWMGVVRTGDRGGQLFFGTLSSLLHDDVIEPSRAKALKSYTIVNVGVALTEVLERAKNIGIDLYPAQEAT